MILLWNCFSQSNYGDSYTIECGCNIVTPKAITLQPHCMIELDNKAFVTWYKVKHLFNTSYRFISVILHWSLDYISWLWCYNMFTTECDCNIATVKAVTVQ